MDKDEKEICNIVSRMLDHPDKNGVYPTSTAYTELELYVEKQRMEVLGWCYSYCCRLLDEGKDPRTEEVPMLIEASRIGLI